LWYSGFNDQDKLLIMGAGGLGMQGIKICRALFPGYKPSVADVDPKKREAALAAGASEAIDPADADQTGPIAMGAMTGQGGFAAIIDFVGAGQTVQGATAMLRRGGSLIVVGLFGGSMPLSTAMLPIRAWKIQGSYVGTPKEMQELADLAAAGKVEEIAIVKRKLEEANDVLAELKAGKIVGRAVLKPNGA
jgi:D-arabinose 1-dehydrogenase-like Zn-dependent alcohol dehydrogenase